MALIVLDPIGDTPPEYCVHGQTFCTVCRAAVWLGDQTYALVAEQGALPICLDCANAMVGTGKLPAKPDRHVDDHKHEEMR